MRCCNHVRTEELLNYASSITTVPSLQLCLLRLLMLTTYEELLLRFQMKIADATAHVTAPSAR